MQAQGCGSHNIKLAMLPSRQQLAFEATVCGVSRGRQRGRLSRRTSAARPFVYCLLACRPAVRSASPSDLVASASPRRSGTRALGLAAQLVRISAPLFLPSCLPDALCSHAARLCAEFDRRWTCLVRDAPISLSLLLPCIKRRLTWADGPPLLLSCLLA